MKDKKGFVFIETIIVISFLATSLIIIYNSFMSILTIEKRRIYYDDPIYLYRTYYILDFLESHNITSYIEAKLSTENDKNSEKLLTEFGCYEQSVIRALSNEQLFCESIINNKHFSVSHIYFTYYDTTPIAECSNDEEDNLKCGAHESLKSLSTNAKEYIRTLGGYGEDGYRIIIEYKEMIGKSPRYYYATVKVPFGE